MNASKDQQSILDHLVGAGTGPIIFPELSSTITIQGVSCLAVGVDNGNDALKLSMLGNDGRLFTQRVPMAIAPARTIQSGRAEATSVVDGIPLWVGAVALRHDGQDIPAGATAQRVVDPRWRQIFFAALADLLAEAGYVPGAYNLVVSLAVPNTEVARDTRSDRLGVVAETAAAIRAHVRGQVAVVQRVDARGATQQWTLTVQQVLGQAQSLGTFTAWSKSPAGRTVQDVEGVLVVDLGGGDQQQTEITVSPYQLLTERIGDGTITLARAFQRSFPGAQLTTLAAQQALMTGQLMLSGRRRDVTHQIQQVLAAEGQNLIGRMLPALRQQRLFVLFTGGGIILLGDLLHERIATTSKRPGEDYALVPPAFASELNSVGALFNLLFKTR